MSGIHRVWDLWNDLFEFEAKVAPVKIKWAIPTCIGPQPTNANDRVILLSLYGIENQILQSRVLEPAGAF